MAGAARVIASKTPPSPGVLFDVLPRGALAGAGARTSLWGQASALMRTANHDMATYWAKSHAASAFADYNEKVFEQELAPVRAQRRPKPRNSSHRAPPRACRTPTKPSTCTTRRMTQMP